MLAESIDVVARGILGNKAIIINCEDIFLLGDHVTKTAASTVLEGDTGGLGAENPVDIVSVVEFVIETLGHADGLSWIPILHNDEMIGLKERPPHLQKIQVPGATALGPAIFVSWKDGDGFGLPELKCKRK